MTNARKSAERVKVVMVQGSNFQAQEKEKTFRIHTCTAVKTPKVPTFLHLLLPILFKKISERKASLVTSQWNEEAKQTHDVGTHTQPPPSSAGADLIPRHIKRWKVKEYQEILRKIKALSKRKDATHHFEFELITEKKEPTKEEKEKSQDQLWQDMMKSNEERHFQIGRITNYFS